MQIDEFKAAVGKYPTGVTIITTSFGDEKFGFTANSFTSVSLKPPIISFCLQKDAASFAAFKDSDYFAISILAAEQADISLHFARHFDDKFAGITTHDADLINCPLITGACSYIQCEKQNMIETGDHFIFTGLVKKVSHNPDKLPLIYYGRQYHNLMQD